MNSIKSNLYFDVIYQIAVNVEKLVMSKDINFYYLLNK